MAESFTEMSERTGIPYAQLLREQGPQFGIRSTVGAEVRDSDERVIAEMNRQVKESAKPGDVLAPATNIPGLDSDREAKMKQARKVLATPNRHVQVSSGYED